MNSFTISDSGKRILRTCKKAADISKNFGKLKYSDRKMIVGACLNVLHAFRTLPRESDFTQYYAHVSRNIQDEKERSFFWLVIPKAYVAYKKERLPKFYQRIRNIRFQKAAEKDHPVNPETVHPDLSAFQYQIDAVGGEEYMRMIVD